ncbi:MAG: isoleucine--tRNA ligase [Thermoguttaceae bacterium]|nr:isoleucine--tRNA ligase [Thermoguttaceae bacterium]MDW8079918.1 isoleucine--tRNA ligase [Thermoguttaceae bacterium]
MFREVDSSVHFPSLEEEILKFWKEHRIYDRSLELRRGGPRFVFYEGPPTANGLPHPGHCLTRAIKDLFPRYRTMRGYYCERKAGWDTHGLPVEVEVSKELGLHSKAQIEAYGVEPFIHKCLESVFRYKKEWEDLTERLGFWIHLEEAYITCSREYVESVWWALKTLFDRGLLYQGYKIVWWWAQGGTVLSSAEVGQGYRQVADPSVYVRLPLLDEPDVDLLIWTTTPWTLPCNQFVAVKPDLEYVVMKLDGDDRRVIVAAALAEQVAAKVGKSYTIERSFLGQALIGKRYRPPFDYYWGKDGNRTGRLKNGGEEYIAWRVVGADFVTIDTGTGVVHQAPAFGEVDYEVLLTEQARFEEGQGPPLICGVAPDGTFTTEVPDYQGRWVKDADPDIIRALRAKGILFHAEQYVHEYPFCWRAEEDPLLQYPRKSWFIRTRQFREQMLANNKLINWLPPEIRDGRFGNFLETNVDWALSRERWWGTPLPIWVCEASGYAEAIGSYAELLSKPDVQGTEVWEQAKAQRPDLPDDLVVHKPYIDAITYASPKVPGARMRRVPDVIDCWFDSGAMPFAQWGFPHVPGSAERFLEQFPADFISEAIDQTRGWFYSLLAISTLLFGEHADRLPPAEAFRQGKPAAIPWPHPFRNCVVLGLMLAEWWESSDGKRRFLTEAEARAACGTRVVRKVGKMSKHLRNYRPPQEIFNSYGADALRWYFFACQPPWTSIIYSEQAIKDSMSEFLLRLWNVYSFFVIYANIDHFEPEKRIAGQADQLTPATLCRGEGYRPYAQRSELDRWILTELTRTTAAVIEAMDRYDNFSACRALHEFVDALSNWYVRRSRGRFWTGEASQDKTDAHWTLYECLITLSKLVAPFIPFTAEAIWQNLAVQAFGDRVRESVHLCDYPQPQPEYVDDVLAARMAVVREIVSLGRSARMSAKLKVRQPLRQVEVVLADKLLRPWLEEHSSLIAEELNVKQVAFVDQAEKYIRYEVLPDWKRLGPRLGRRLPELKEWLAQVDGSQVLRRLEEKGMLTAELPSGPVELSREDLQVRLHPKPGWTAAQGRSAVVILSTEVDEALLVEGVARELAHVVNTCRRQAGCRYTDRIRLSVVSSSDLVRQAVRDFHHYLCQETLAVELTTDPLVSCNPMPAKVGDDSVTIYLEVAEGSPACSTG